MVANSTPQLHTNILIMYVIWISNFDNVVRNTLFKNVDKCLLMF